jgi:hypothetical protein
MRPIDKFILHIIHNWENELNEAYEESTVKKFIEKFKEEADDLNIQITDEQLKKYIERFDVLKNSPKITEKDLNKWTLSKLIKLVTSSAGAEIEEKDTPDVVYHEGSIIIWNGSKENNCITYGRGERWCITKTSWADHRYDENKGYPTFYLAKNASLPDSDKLSFVVIAILDPSIAREDKQYVLHDRTNSPHYPPPTSFNDILNKCPWLNDIPNIKNILKYTPLSSSEKTSQIYKNRTVSVREWTNFPFEVKKQYLVVRKDKDLFSDIKNYTFVEKYLSKYPQIATFIATTAGVLPSMILVKNLDKFSNQDRRSIISNLREKIPLRELSKDFLFDIKKLLTTLDKWELSNNQRIYVTKDGQTIVLLKLDKNDVKIELHTEEDDYPNVKLNKRTSKYLLDYPYLDKIPFTTLSNLISDGVLDKSIIDNIIKEAETNKDSAIIVKPLENGDKILVDSNTFTAFKLEGDKINNIDFNNEEVQNIIKNQVENEGFQQNIIKLFGYERTDSGINIIKDIPNNINQKSLADVLKMIPYDKRLITVAEDQVPSSVVLTTNVDEYPIMIVPLTSKISTNIQNINIFQNDGTVNDLKINMPVKKIYESYFTYLRAKNQAFTSDELVYSIRKLSEHKAKALIASNPPLTNNNIYRPYINGDEYMLVNIENPNDSLLISNRSGKLISKRVPFSVAAQLVGTTPAALRGAGQAVAAPLARRGRPAGRQNTPATPPAEPNNVTIRSLLEPNNLVNGFNSLPRIWQQRFFGNGINVDLNGNRGASRRQNLLGNAGQVVRAVEFGGSAVYLIRLANNNMVASLVVQPGNSHWIITSNGAISLDSPANLLQALQQRDLAEVHQYIMNEYLDRNPHHIKEFKNLLRKHINKKNENK